MCRRYCCGVKDLVCLVEGMMGWKVLYGERYDRLEGIVGGKGWYGSVLSGYIPF